MFAKDLQNKVCHPCTGNKRHLKYFENHKTFAFPSRGKFSEDPCRTFKYVFMIMGQMP